MSKISVVHILGFHGVVESLKLVGVVGALKSTGYTCQASIGALSTVN